MAEPELRHSSQERLTIILTGFGSFKGVPANPTEVLVQWLDEQYVEHPSSPSQGTAKQPARSLPKHAYIQSAHVLRVSGRQVDSYLKVLAQDLEALNGEPGPVLLLHFGVDIKRAWFNLECRAFNNANFRCADEDGWEPCHLPIEQPRDANISSGSNDSMACLDTVRACGLDLDRLQRQLAACGHNVRLSDDAGRFVCNYIYYKSLMCSSCAKGRRCYSLFVHFPTFEAVGPDQQKAFVVDLLEALAEMLTQPEDLRTNGKISSSTGDKGLVVSAYNSLTCLCRSMLQ